MTSRRILSEALKCPPSKIESLLTMMESEQQIRQQKKAHNRLISMVNWHTYQGSLPQNEQQTDSQPTTNLPQNDPSIVVNREELRIKKKDIKQTPPACEFEELWKQYPRRLGRKEAEKHFNASVKSDVDLADIKKALANYIASRVGEDPTYNQHGATWFNNWRDWVDYQPTKETTNGNSRIIS